jgi:Ser/Thr protein kinase RdoA (MazF antagonist)
MTTDMGDEYEQCRQLLQAWDLGQVTGIERQLGGATNRVYRIQAGVGVSFLRIYRRADPALAEREHVLIVHARRQGVPAVALLTARSGSSVVQVEGVVCALYEAATGMQLPNGELGSSDAIAAAACLGHLHRALQPLPDAGYLRWQIAWDGPEWIERLNAMELALSRRGLGTTPIAGRLTACARNAGGSAIQTVHTLTSPARRARSSTATTRP